MQPRASSILPTVHFPAVLHFEECHSNEIQAAYFLIKFTVAKPLRANVDCAIAYDHRTAQISFQKPKSFNHVPFSKNTKRASDALDPEQYRGLDLTTSRTRLVQHGTHQDEGFVFTVRIENPVFRNFR